MVKQTVYVIKRDDGKYVYGIKDNIFDGLKLKFTESISKAIKFMEEKCLKDKYDVHCFITGEEFSNASYKNCKVIKVEICEVCDD